MNETEIRAFQKSNRWENLSDRTNSTRYIEPDRYDTDLSMFRGRAIGVCRIDPFAERGKSV